MYGKKVRGIESRSQRTIARKQDATEQERAHKQTRETTKRKHKEREREREMEKWREREKQSKAVIRACQCVQRVIETARIETHDCTGVCRRGAVRDWNLLQEALHSEICHLLALLDHFLVQCCVKQLRLNSLPNATRQQ